MQSNAVEVADKASRRRAMLVGVAAIIFVASQILGHPFFDSSGPSDLHISRRLAWAVNVILLLALLATGGGLLNSREIRVLMNDEVSRMNYRTSVVTGFWVAMISALVLIGVPALTTLTGAQAGYLVVTIAVAVTSVAFSWLELRAHRDG